MAEDNIADDTQARQLMNDFFKPQGPLLKYQQLYPNLHYNMCKILHQVEALYSDISQTTDISDIDIKLCIRILMESIQKIKSKCEYEKKLSTQLSEVHSWYFRWKLEAFFLDINPFPLANSAQTFEETMTQWAQWEEFSQILGKFSSARDVLYKSLVSKDPHPRDYGGGRRSPTYGQSRQVVPTGIKLSNN